MRFISHSEKQTFNLAKKMARQITGGQVIGLIGGLGAGKTVFTKGLAAGLDIKKTITSPTFVLMRIYPVKCYQLIKTFVHIDAYRLKKIENLIAIGAVEYFNRPNTITVIEWADKIKPILPKRTKFVKITITINKDTRTINY